VPSTREELLLRGVRLEIGTVLWNAIEGIIAIIAGVMASSVALIGFGIDSFVETASAAVVGWRLRAELTDEADHERTETLERLTGRIAGALLLALAVYIVVDAGRRLLGFGAEARESTVGIVVTAISLVVMPSSVGPSSAPQPFSVALRSERTPTRPSPAPGSPSPRWRACC
jgi:divalent metal cation (Fe/Co/Zn/Cd) transporter